MGEQLNLFGQTTVPMAEPVAVEPQEEPADVASGPLPGQMDLFGDRWLRAAAAHRAIETFDLDTAADSLRETMRSYPSDAPLRERADLVAKLAASLRKARRKNKKKTLPPRRKRMKRAARLQSARHWLPTYGGKNIVRGYARWFGVDLECALKEVQLLGVTVDPDYVQQLRVTMRERARSKPHKEPTAPDVPDGYGAEWEDEFAYIDGNTSGGATYGITREEEERLATVELREACDDDDPIPF